MFRFPIVIISTFCFNPTSSEPLVNLTNLSKCKLSHLGLEYKGDIDHTESGVLCQDWVTSTPVHPVNPTFNDTIFPDNSMQRAKNFCRNPNREPWGPWCYTIRPDLIDETCRIPLCRIVNCRITGPGMEYAGNYSVSTTSRKCLKWNKKQKNIKIGGMVHKQEVYDSKLFPEESVKEAKNYCRNPDGDPGGPWCFVKLEEELKTTAQKEYCNIPFCDSYCVTYLKNQESYTHLTKFNNDDSNFTFGIKAWDSDDFRNTSLQLILTALPTLMGSADLTSLEVGIEITLTNFRSALTQNSQRNVEWVDTTNFISSDKFTYFSVLWQFGYVTLQKVGEYHEIFQTEFKHKNNLVDLDPENFLYYSIRGSNLVWTFPKCLDEDHCEVHVTNSLNFERYWMLEESQLGYEINFYLRAHHSAVINLLATPTKSYPNFQMILNLKTNETVLYYYDEGIPKTLIKELRIPNLLNYWEWRELSLTLFNEKLKLFWTRNTGTQIVYEAEHPMISNMRWFSIGSDNTVAHWTLYCRPLEEDAVPNSWPPECSVNEQEFNYRGSQRVAEGGVQCLPWVDPGIPVEFRKNELFEEDGSMVFAQNFCRNPLNEQSGAFCFIKVPGDGRNVTKSFCDIRKCRSSECRMAGTGNDYIGKLNITRTNRTCQNWNTNTPHHVNPNYLNDTLYAEMNSQQALNYCRNPSRSMVGAWCYTTDPNVPKDVCNVRDCIKPEESIVLTRGNGYARTIYVLPEWKEESGGLHFSLKQWDPDLTDGIIFAIYPFNGTGSYLFYIGNENNEKVELFSGSELLKTKTLPELIAIGKWTDFWLQIPKGKIRLGYEGLDSVLFEWVHDDIDRAFVPGFITYMSLKGGTIGVSFMNRECHTEVTTIRQITRLMPVGWGRTEELLYYDNITIYLRGNGSARVTLMHYPEDSKYYMINLGDWVNQEGHFIVIATTFTKPSAVLKLKPFPYLLFGSNNWTKFEFKFKESFLDILRDGEIILQYQRSAKFKDPFIFYWFSVGAENGVIKWTANCEPPGIDGPPIDGGWSPWTPWTCTVSCGGGTGYRTRTCTNPRPNIFGRLCEGRSISTGRCNEFECGDISPEIIEEIFQDLHRNNLHFELFEGDQVLLENFNEIITKIEKQSPKATFKWIMNGFEVDSQNGHIDFVGNDLEIQSVNYTDTGVYICVLRRLNGEQLIIRLASIAVTPKTIQVHKRATQKVNIKCNSLVLAYAFSGLRLKWTINGEVYKDFGITTLAAVDTLEIPVEQSHTGTWKCIISQPDLNFTWTTNIIKMEIKDKPNFYSHLMEDEFPSLIFGRFQTETGVLIMLWVIIVGFFVVSFGGVYCYKRLMILPTRKTEMKKRKMVQRKR